MVRRTKDVSFVQFQKKGTRQGKGEFRDKKIKKIPHSFSQFANNRIRGGSSATACAVITARHGTYTARHVYGTARIRNAHPGCGVFQFFKIAMPKIPLEDGPCNVLALGDPSKSDVNVRILNFWLKIDFSAKIEVFFTFLSSFSLSPSKNRYFEKKICPF